MNVRLEVVFHTHFGPDQSNGSTTESCGVFVLEQTGVREDCGSTIFALGLFLLSLAHEGRHRLPPRHRSASMAGRTLLSAKPQIPVADPSTLCEPCVQFSRLWYLLSCRRTTKRARSLAPFKFVSSLLLSLRDSCMFERVSTVLTSIQSSGKGPFPRDSGHVCGPKVIVSVHCVPRNGGAARVKLAQRCYS